MNEENKPSAIDILAPVISKAIEDVIKKKPFETMYAAALTGVCSNHILAQMFVEQAKSGIVGAQVNIPETLAKQAHAIATAAIQLLDNESKTGF